MTWFKVDDSFYDHPKIFDAPDCAVALWSRAGCYSARSRSDGFVPTGMPARLCDDPERAIKELLDRGLWRRTKGGYRFHDWLDYQPSRQEVVESRTKMSSGGALGNHRRWHTEKGVVDASCTFCQGKHDRGSSRQPDRAPDTMPESGASPPVPSRPAPKKQQPPLPPKGGESNPAFDAFWAVYPRKVGKPNGLKAWRAALKRGHDPDKITAAARRYAETRRGQDAQYTAHPATWLNGERYNDPEPQVTDDEAGWWNN